MKYVIVKKDLFSADQLDWLNNLYEDVTCVEESGETDLNKAHAVIGNFPTTQLASCENLEWVQLNSSGADAYAVTEHIGKSVVITTATGAYGIGIAEYMVAMLLNMMKKVPAYLEDQKKGIWADEGTVTTPFGKRVLIVGTGNIGTEFAKRMRAFGSEIIGIRKRVGECPSEYDAVYGMDALKDELGKADVVALCLPGTAQTNHLMDEEMLLSCKKGAYLMNVGRGDVIPLDAFLDQTVAEQFEGIWLDVCEVEPLPEGHGLYSVPNLLLTPHITGGFHLDLTCRKIFEIAENNLKAWHGDEEYVSVLNRESGYCCKQR